MSVQESSQYHVYIDELPDGTSNSELARVLSLQFDIVSCDVHTRDVNVRSEKPKTIFGSSAGFELEIKLPCYAYVTVRNANEQKWLVSADKLTFRRKTLKFEAIPHCERIDCEDAVRQGLNDDVLREIFSYLDVPQAMIAASVCKSWMRVIYDMYGKYERMDCSNEDLLWTCEGLINQSFNPWTCQLTAIPFYDDDSENGCYMTSNEKGQFRLAKEVPHFKRRNLIYQRFLKMLIVTGENLTELTLQGVVCSKRALEAVAVYAPQLKKLAILPGVSEYFGVTIKDEDLFNTFSTWDNELEVLIISVNLKSSFLCYLSRSSLKSLSLCCIEDFESFNLLPKSLVQLSVKYTKKSKSKTFKNRFHELVIFPKLRHLQIIRHKFDQVDLNAVSSSVPGLELLTVSLKKQTGDQEQIVDFSHFISLKKLCVTISSNQNVQLILPPKLEVLVLKCWLTRHDYRMESTLLPDSLHTLTASIGHPILKKPLERSKVKKVCFLDGKERCSKEILLRLATCLHVKEIVIEGYLVSKDIFKSLARMREQRYEKLKKDYDEPPVLKIFVCDRYDSSCFGFTSKLLVVEDCDADVADRESVLDSTTNLYASYSEDPIYMSGESEFDLDFYEQVQGQGPLYPMTKLDRIFYACKSNLFKFKNFFWKRTSRFGMYDVHQFEILDDVYLINKK